MKPIPIAETMAILRGEKRDRRVARMCDAMAAGLNARASEMRRASEIVRTHEARQKSAVHSQKVIHSKRRREAVRAIEGESAAVLERQRDYLMSVIALASEQLAAGEPDRAQAALSTAAAMWNLE